MNRTCSSSFFLKLRAQTTNQSYGRAEEASLLKVELPTDDEHKRLLDVQDDLADRARLMTY